MAKKPLFLKKSAVKTVKKGGKSAMDSIADKPKAKTKAKGKK